MLKFCDVINCIFVHSPKKLTLVNVDKCREEIKARIRSISERMKGGCENDQLKCVGRIGTNGKKPTVEIRFF